MKVTISQLSDWTGLDRRTVKRRLEGLPFDDGGRAGHHYESRDALKRLYLGEITTDETLDPQQERAQLDAARRRLAELEYQRRRGELIESDVVENHWVKMASNCRSRLLTLPSRLATAVVACTTVPEIEKSAKAIIYEALAELAKTGKPAS